jgi:hypothetical protein
MKSTKHQAPSTKQILNFKFGILKLFGISDLRFGASRGFTLLLAVLISGVLLALGLALYNIAVKELILASAGRDSQFAFYAADAGRECALYWDSKHDAFAPASPLTEIICASGTLPPVGMGGGVASLTRIPGSGPDPTDTITFSFSLGGNQVDSCTDVTVTRQYEPTRTTIRSRGYSTCVTTNPRRLERAIRSSF